MYNNREDTTLAIHPKSNIFIITIEIRKIGVLGWESIQEDLVLLDSHKGKLEDSTDQGKLWE